MRNTVKLNKILTMNDLKISRSVYGEYEVIITNKESGNAHLVTHNSYTGVIDKAYRDTKKVATDGHLSF